MRPPTDEEIERIAGLIVAHWELHPDATDEVKGVVWWIPQTANAPEAWVEKALAQLVERGVAIRRRHLDGRIVYLCAKRRLPGP